jgi:outer membrane protein
MKRKSYILVIGLLLTITAYGQEPWSLDRCIAYARAHATEVGRQRLEMQQKKADYRTALLDFLPSVSAEVSAQYSWGRNIDPETNTYNNVTTFNNYYALGGTVTLFDFGATWNAFRQARLDRAVSSTAVQKAGDDKAMSVMEKYVDAVYTRRTIDLMDEKLQDSRALLAKTKRLFELGEKSRPDIVQVESQVAEDEYNLLHQRNLAAKAMNGLKAEMNFPADDSLSLALLPVDVSAAAQLPANRRACDSLVAHGYFLSDRPDVTLAEATAERARLEWQIQRAALLPKLTLSGGVATNYYKNLTAGGYSEGFGSQFHNNMGEYIYITISIPLFSPSSWNRARRAKTDWQKARLDVEDTRRRQHDNTVQAVLDYRGYAREVKQLQTKVASDSLAHYLSNRKYEEGMLSVFDLHTTAQTLLQSRLMLLQSEMMLALKARLVRYYLTGEM